MALSNIRNQLQMLRSSSDSLHSRRFVPEGSLENLLNLDQVIHALSDESFGIPAHKRETTARIVCDEASKIFAILLELHLEHLLAIFIVNDIFDDRLPLDDHNLKLLVPEAAGVFGCLQHEYSAYRFRTGQYHKKLPNHTILPYIRQKLIGGGGFSSVYKVWLHPAHQDFSSNDRPSGVVLIRKELKPFCLEGQAETELLFLLGSLKHPNIVELVASYTQDSVSNLLFHPADLDLHDFLLQSSKPAGFGKAFSFQEAMHGLSDGLSYLHNFRPRPNAQKTNSKVSMHGYHHDIKPRNVLVRGTDFILADFGTSKMKAVDDTSQTSWKNTTFEYGAPECRDPESLAVGTVRRSLDIWSLACIFSEVVTYAESGSQGVVDFRQRRLREGPYGKLQCFHDDKILNPVVRTHLNALEEASPHSSTRKVLSIILRMFATKPADRLLAGEVQINLADACVEALLDALIQSIEDIMVSVGKTTSQNLYTMRLEIEKNRLLAWGGTLGIKKIYQISKPLDQQVLASFTDVCRTLKTAINILENGTNFDDANDAHDFVLSHLQHTSNQLSKHLTPESQESADRMFLIITANMRDIMLAQDIDQLGLMSCGQYNNDDTRSAIKYMTLLLEGQSKKNATNHRIEASLIRQIEAKFDILARPQIHSYSYGYRDGEERKVILETMPYWQKQHRSNSEEFQQAIQAMFSRVQDLVEILQARPLPINLRILDCLGTFHDPQKAGFELVYGFPSERTVPIRLNKLLRHRKSSEVYPGLGQKLVLAKTLVACIQCLHTFGWIHKTLSSFNVLFFHDPEHKLSDLDFGQPYMIGLDHSRRDGKGEYSQPALNSANPGSSTDFVRACREYLHPDYRLGSVTSGGASPFIIAYDYYSLGLLLLEIGTWTSLSNIYDSTRFQNCDPRHLRQEYINYCDEHLGKATGPIFQSVTKRCLQYNAMDVDKVSAEIIFQAEVVDQLGRCVF